MRKERKRGGGLAASSNTSMELASERAVVLPTSGICILHIYYLASWLDGWLLQADLFITLELVLVGSCVVA